MEKLCIFRTIRALALSTCVTLFSFVALPAVAGEWSVARHWNEELLHAIRNDYARPTVHARNLYHVSGAMWDAWAAFDPGAMTVIHHEPMSSSDIKADREEAISYAAYRLMVWRFTNSPGAAETLPSLDAKMDALGYDRTITTQVGQTPAALGNRIAQTYIDYGLTDNANEQGSYENLYYEPVNEPLLPAFPGNPDISDPNRWQPLALEFFVDQSGNPLPLGTPEFLSPEWGYVKPFSLQPGDLTIYNRDGFDYWVYHDPGPPPYIGGEGDHYYKAGFEQVAIWSGLLDPSDGVMIDISPNSRGNNTFGTNDGNGYPVNPRTGQPYTPQIVPAGDYYRVLAEFWADGPDSETPPGHWFTIANYVSDHPMVVKRLRGDGPVLDDLEWDVKLYLALGGGMHDVAIASWGVKGWYDYIRPISAIRYMCDNGQSSNPQGPSYHPHGISLHPGKIEVITEQTAAPGGRHFPLGGNMGQHIGKIALYAWKGPDYIVDPMTDVAGVGWIRCEDWWPYQRPTFVTPPFAGYVSGHSTYSRAAALIMSEFSGDEFFPGGLGEFHAPQNEFLVFEDGPSVDVTLQWAKYYDACDETSISRIYGGIHPPADDIPGRFMGAAIGKDALRHALTLFGESFPTRATFNVSKTFDDGNPAAVEVTLSCNTGIPLLQKKLVTEDQGVEFVINSYDPGELNCSVFESVPLGYEASYAASLEDGLSDYGNLFHDGTGCYFEGIADGQFRCDINNELQPVTIGVYKEWIDEHPEYDLPLYAQVDLTCDNASVTGSSRIIRPGDPAFYSVFPHYAGTNCEVSEQPAQGVLGDTGDCSDLYIAPGSGDMCTVVNTRLFENVPTLDRYGIAVLVLLMLGIGWVGFRRMI